MIIPIRCYACAKVIGNMWQKYQEYLTTMEAEEALNKLGLKRYCCRRMLLSHVEIIDEMLEQITDVKPAKIEELELNFEIS